MIIFTFGSTFVLSLICTSQPDCIVTVSNNVPTIQNPGLFLRCGVHDDDDLIEYAEGELHDADDVRVEDVHVEDSDGVHVEDSDGVHVEDSDAVNVETSDGVEHVEHDDAVNIEASDGVHIEHDVCDDEYEGSDQLNFESQDKSLSCLTC